MESIGKTPVSEYQELYSHMANEHSLTLLTTELQEVVRIAKKISEPLPYEMTEERHYDPARRLLKTMQKANAINQSTFNHYWKLLAEKDKEFEY